MDWLFAVGVLGVGRLECCRASRFDARPQTGRRIAGHTSAGSSVQYLPC
ncbi:MAG: hypothetical protein MZV64_15485 [Ignavibacteriales bacterium]|nr:hypothetical protein [Ignavibacteriales bacterium]